MIYLISLSIVNLVLLGISIYLRLEIKKKDEYVKELHKENFAQRKEILSLYKEKSQPEYDDGIPEETFLRAKNIAMILLIGYLEKKIFPKDSFKEVLNENNFIDHIEKDDLFRIVVLKSVKSCHKGELDFSLLMPAAQELVHDLTSLVVSNFDELIEEGKNGN